MEPIRCGKIRKCPVCSCRTLTSPWGNEDTQTLIDTLTKYGVKATFFLVGQWADKYPESEKQIIDEVSLACGKIEAITGGKVELFRCPYGEYNDQVITTVRNMGIQPIQWDVERSHTAESP